MKKIAVFSFLIFSLFLAKELIENHQKIPFKIVEKNEISDSNKGLREVKKEVLVQNESKPNTLHSRVKKKTNNTKINAPSSQVSPRIEDSKYQHFQLPDGSLILTQVVVQDGLLVAHGDLIVGREEDLPSIQNGSKPLVIPRPILWTKGVIPYRLKTDLSLKPFISEAMEYMESKTNIKFKKWEGEKDFITFKDGSENCYANLGRIGGEQFITLASGCRTYEIVHEIMHALGFFHEQNRSDRDDYIRILWENIEEVNWLQFQVIENTFLELTKFPFDFDSVMLYSSKAFSVYKGDYSMVTIDGDPFRVNTFREDYLSPLDIKKVNYYYSDTD